MPERKYFVLCNDNCRFEGMTKEQIYAAIAEATGHTPTPVDEAFITMIKEQNANKNIKVWKGTAAQYNALATKDSNTLYFVDTNKIEAVDLPDVWPISKGGTGATTEQAARTNLGLKGAEIKTLLWTNASPTSQFPAQTINLNLSGFKAIAIGFSFSNDFPNGDSYNRTRNIVGKGGTFVGADSSSGTWVSRQFTVRDTGIEFSIGYSSWNGGSQSNVPGIPQIIYGIKEV